MNATEFLNAAGHNVTTEVEAAAERVGYETEDERAQVMLTVMLHSEADAAEGTRAPWEPQGLAA